jgi:hypothetical protein
MPADISASNVWLRPMLMGVEDIEVYHWIYAASIS